MCGIVGLHLTEPLLWPRLGELLTPMLDRMASRGPDSAGIALYGEPSPGGETRYSLRADRPRDWQELAGRLAAKLGVAVTAQRRADAAVLLAPGDPDRFLRCLREAAPDVMLAGYGRAIEVYKDVGAPRDICERYDVPKRDGYQAIGHTRMATESAVTTTHSHPFGPAPDLALVHNGSFSNYATVRRWLASRGTRFDTDNDSEVAARYIAYHMAAGADLGTALQQVLARMDGFFTLLVATATQLAVVRDWFACKPAVIAETDGYAAVASEYQALAGLPGIGDATVFEPAPGEVHVWTR